MRSSALPSASRMSREVMTASSCALLLWYAHGIRYHQLIRDAKCLQDVHGGHGHELVGAVNMSTEFAITSSSALPSASRLSKEFVATSRPALRKASRTSRKFIHRLGRPAQCLEMSKGFMPMTSAAMPRASRASRDLMATSFSALVRGVQGVHGHEVGRAAQSLKASRDFWAHLAA